LNPSVWISAIRYTKYDILSMSTWHCFCRDRPRKLLLVSGMEMWFYVYHKTFAHQLLILYPCVRGTSWESSHHTGDRVLNRDLNCSSYWSHENKVQNRGKFLINLHWFSPWNWSWWCCTVKDIAGCHQQRGVSNIKFRSRLGKKTSWQGHRGEWYDVGHFWCRAMVIHNTLSQAVFVRCDGNKG